MQLEMKRHVVIVGAGIIGASIAYHLSLYGMRVTVIDAEGPSAGASGASDGAVAIATKSPGCLMDLALRSKDYYSELSQTSGPLCDVYHERPTFLVATNDAEVAFVTDQVESLRQAGVSLRALEGRALHTTLPELRQDIPLVLEIQKEGHALGYEVVQHFLQGCDATIRRKTVVTGLELQAGSDRCAGVRTADGVISADDVVVAAGLGSSWLISGLDLQAQRGQLLVTDRSEITSNFPGALFFASYLAVKAGLTDDESLRRGGPDGGALVIDPLCTGQILIGSTREPSDDLGHTEFATVQHILKQAIDYMPVLCDLNVRRVFAGIRARTKDGLPVVGQVPGCDGLWAATGFAGDGICLAPLVGRELGNMMAGRNTLADFDSLSPARLGATLALA
jgi:glycine/D-amino acid oxidase-like deaminating enzyme